MDSIQAALSAFIEKSGMSQSAVARGVGVSASVINQFLQGKYSGNNSEIGAQIESWLRRQAGKNERKKTQIPYVPTQSAKNIQTLLELAHEECEVVVVYGQAGLGKTRAMTAYCEQNRDVIFIESDPSFTAKVLMQEIAAKIGVETRGSLHEISEAIIAKLKDSERLIIVDEAELLPLRALEFLRRIHDKAGIGLVLCGMPRLVINLKGSKGELKQLYSRVGFSLNLGNSIDAADLRQIAARTLPEAAEDVLTALVESAAGNTRHLVKLLAGVARMMRINQAAADVEMVRRYREMMIL